MIIMNMIINMNVDDRELKEYLHNPPPNMDTPGQSGQCHDIWTSRFV